MEGRAIARPNRVIDRMGQRRTAPSMEGRAIARPNARGRFGHLHHGVLPSMEGRAIARPNQDQHHNCRKPSTTLQWRAGQLPGQTRRRAPQRGRLVHPSMEGRAIARPNDAN